MTTRMLVMCDCDDRCTAHIAVPAQSTWDARSAAEEHGWITGLDADYAPGHIDPEQEES